VLFISHHYIQSTQQNMSDATFSTVLLISISRHKSSHARPR